MIKVFLKKEILVNFNFRVHRIGQILLIWKMIMMKSSPYQKSKYYYFPNSLINNQIKIKFFFHNKIKYNNKIFNFKINNKMNK
jgi:hypothetical protein